MNLSERLAAARTARRAEAGLPPDPSPDDGVAAFFGDDDVVIDLRDRRPPDPTIDGMTEEDFLASLRDPNAVLTYSWAPGPANSER